MADSAGSAASVSAGAANNSSSSSNPQARESAETLPFQTQLEDLYSAPPLPAAAAANPYGQHAAFNMTAMAGALPPNPNMAQRLPFAPGAHGQILSPPNHFQAQQLAFQTQRGNPLPGQPQPPPFYAPQYGPAQMNFARQQPFPIQAHAPFAPVDSLGYPLSPAGFSPIDPRFAASSPMGLPGLPLPDMAQFTRRPSNDSAPIPSFPRGPPRKPKQSGHALWVGNLPPQASIIDLKDHFSREATNEIESVFLIAKSNCAFVNYCTEAACTAAMNRFHDSRFHGVRLVCRLRRGTTSSTTSTPIPDEADEVPAPAEEPPEEIPGPTIARTPSALEQQSIDESPSQPRGDERVPEKYFIVKSLTAQDLEASVRNSIWATQSHNEEALNRAYQTADHVYLIFSANKSGEYFGYARMASSISGEPVSLPSAASAGGDDIDGSTGGIGAGSPQSIRTAATASAPRGCVIDDSARGTIFWEADRDVSAEPSEGFEGQTPDPSSPASGGQNWGKQFSIEWKSTSRLPFYRTRGLRNPWNANREVKIARDGTELEPTVGKKLIGMFHGRQSASGGQGQQGQGQSAGPGSGPASTMGYR